MSIVTERAPMLNRNTLLGLTRQAFEQFQIARAEDERIATLYLTAQANRDAALRQFTGLAQALEVQVVEWGDDPPFTKDELETVIAESDHPDFETPVGCPKLWRMACLAAERPRRY